MNNGQKKKAVSLIYISAGQRPAEMKYRATPCGNEIQGNALRK